MGLEKVGENSAGYPIYERKRAVDKTSPEEPAMSRRGFLKLAGAGAATAAAGYALWPERDSVDTESVEPPEAEPVPETVEILRKNEQFEKESLGWQRWWQLRYNQVLFVDESGAPVGEPVGFENFVVQRTRTGDDGEPEEFDYLLAPGAENDDGMLMDNIAAEWLRYVEARHARRYNVTTQELQQRNVTEEFEQAVARDDEPALQESIVDAVQGGNGVETMVDLLQYYGMNPDKPVRGDIERRTRAEYLQEEILFHNRIPRVVQEELKRLVVGLAAQESRFNAGLPKNSATAWGIMQLTDDVREEHGHDPDVKLSFRQEVEVAGKHFSNIYTRVRHWMQHSIERDSEGNYITKDSYERLRKLFSAGQTGEEAWQKYFLVPCMINAYNAGSWTIGACLHEFVAAHTDEELKAIAGEHPGYDLFQTFTHFAKANTANQYTEMYGEDAQAYTVSIVGCTKALETDVG